MKTLVLLSPSLLWVSKALLSVLPVRLINAIHTELLQGPSEEPQCPSKTCHLGFLPSLLLEHMTANRPITPTCLAINICSSTCSTVLLFDWFLSWPIIHRAPQWFCVWALSVAYWLCVASLSAQPSWVSSQAGQDITMSQRWLMAVLSQGLMTSSLVLSFVSPTVSVSKQKREAICSRCDPTLPHCCWKTHERRNRGEQISSSSIRFYYAAQHPETVVTKTFCLTQGSTGLPSLCQADDMLSPSPIWSTHLSSASAWR